MRNRRFHSTGKGSPPPYRQGKVMPQAVFGKIILAGGSGIFQMCIRDRAKVPLWFYAEPNPRYGDFTTETYRKFYLHKREESENGNLYQGR